MVSSGEGAHQQALDEASVRNWHEAESHARRAVETGGDRFAGTLGQILIKTGKLAEAQECLLRAVMVDQNDIWAHVGLATLHAHKRDRSLALASLDRVLAIQPDFPGARHDREAMAQEVAALEQARRALDGYAKRRDLDVTDLAAEIEIPSVGTTADGRPRFSMAIPVAEISNDLGAAHLFCREVYEGGYELPLRRFLDLHLLPDDVFIDVGAHWGIHSLTAASRWPGQVDVLAIEAHPINAERLGHWVRRNGLDRSVEVINKVLSDCTGTAQLAVNTSSMGHSARREGISAGLTTLSVDTDTLDNLLVQRPYLRWRRAILKLDVEGCERAVLAGAHALLGSKDVMAVIWEKGVFHQPDVQRSLDKEILDLLSSFGFDHLGMDEAGTVVPLRENAVCDVYSIARDYRRTAFDR